MLDNIKSYISNMPDNSFDEYYQKYVLAVQDRNIEMEMNFNSNTFISINKLITAIHRELGNIS